jgi:RimJ/RimL family protein N-acetyltransferase
MTILPKDAFPRSIRTARLHLRKPEPAEESSCARHIFEAYATASEPVSLGFAREIAAFTMEHWARYGFGFLFVDLSENGQTPVTIGHAGFKYAGAYPGHWEERPDGIELAYSLLPSARGSGYMTESARAALGAAFAAFDVPKISARCHHSNPASAAVLARCGMTEIEPTERFRRFELARPE